MKSDFITSLYASLILSIFVNMKIKKMNKKTEIASGVITLAIGSLMPNPIAAAAIDKIVYPILADFMDRMLSKSQKNRIEKVLEDAIKKIASRLEKNDIPSGEGEYWTEGSIKVSDAKAILEGVLLKVRDEYEEKKLPYYSNLIAQMAFDHSWSYQRLNAMIRMFEQLSYRQLQLMALALRKGEIETPQWDVKFKRTPESYVYYDLFCEVVNLSNLALFHQPGTSLKMGLGDKHALSPIGKSMAELMELSSMPQEELDDLDNMINLLNDKILKM